MHRLAHLFINISELRNGSLLTSVAREWITDITSLFVWPQAPKLQQSLSLPTNNASRRVFYNDRRPRKSRPTNTFGTEAEMRSGTDLGISPPQCCEGGKLRCTDKKLESYRIRSELPV